MNLVFYMKRGSLMCHSVNVKWKIAVQNAGSDFAYFCGGHKKNFGYNFTNPFNKY